MRQRRVDEFALECSVLLRCFLSEICRFHNSFRDSVRHINKYDVNGKTSQCLFQVEYVLSVLYVLVTSLFAAIKNLGRSSLRREGFVSASQFEVTVHCDGKFLGAAV